MRVTFWEPDDGPRENTSRVTITVHPPEQTRPIGFAPWPETKKRKKRAARKREAVPPTRERGRSDAP